MLSRAISLIFTVRVIESNLLAAASFSPEDRSFMAEYLFQHQGMISAIMNTVVKGGDADKEQKIKVLSEGGRGATELWRRMGSKGRNDPMANMANTVEGLYFETALSLRRPLHEKYVVRINNCISKFVAQNLSTPARAQIRGQIKEQLKSLYESLGADTPTHPFGRPTYE